MEEVERAAGRAGTVEAWAALAVAQEARQAAVKLGLTLRLLAQRPLLRRLAGMVAGRQEEARHQRQPEVEMVAAVTDRRHRIVAAGGRARWPPKGRSFHDLCASVPILQSSARFGSGWFDRSRC